MYVVQQTGWKKETSVRVEVCSEIELETTSSLRRNTYHVSAELLGNLLWRATGVLKHSVPSRWMMTDDDMRCSSMVCNC